MRTWMLCVLAMASGCVTHERINESTALSCSDPECINPVTGNGDATTGIDETGWWFASGTWHIPYTGPEGAVITGISVDLMDNGPGNAKPSAPVVISIRSSSDGGTTWTTISSITTCGCGAEGTISPPVIYDTSQGMFEIALSSPTSNPSYVFGIRINATTVFTEVPISYASFVNEFPAVNAVDYANARIEGPSLHVAADTRMYPGQILISAKASVIDTTTSSDFISLIMRCIDGSLSTIATSQPSAKSSNIQIISISPLVELPYGCGYVLSVDASGTTSTSVLAATLLTIQ
jgi:hypothetical protein